MTRLGWWAVVVAGSFQGLVSPAVASAQAEMRAPVHVGASVFRAILLGSDDEGMGGLLDVTWGGGLSAYRSEGRWGVGGELSTMSVPAQGSGDGTHVSTRLFVLSGGPILSARIGPVTPFAQPVAVGAAARRGDDGVDPGDGRWSMTAGYGLAAGLRLPVATGDRHVSVTVGGRLLGMGELTFVRPATGSFAREVTLLTLGIAGHVGL